MNEEKQFKDAYEAGFDAGLNGPNTENCNFAFFNTPENTRQWEMGNAAGLIKFKPFTPHE